MRRPQQTQWQDAYAVIEPQINAEGKHVFPFDPVFPIAAHSLRFGQRREIRANRHDYFELLLVRSGSVVYQVQDRRIPLGAGDLFVMGSTLMHRMCEFPKGEVKAAVLYFMPDLIPFGDPQGDGVEYLSPFLVQDDGFPHVVPASTGIPAQVLDFMNRAALELPATTNRGRLTVKTYLKMILVLLVNHYAAFRGSEEVHLRKHEEYARLRPVFDYIDHHYAEPISIDDASSLLPMSKSHFMRFFKQVTGQPFVSYLNRFRIAKAERLLETTNMTIAEIALSVGFYDQSYFGFMFRSLVHMTPREYRHMVEERGRELQKV